MSFAINVLEDLKHQLLDKLGGATGGAKGEIAATLALVDRLMVEGKFDEAELTLERLDPILDRARLDLGTAFDPAFLAAARERIKAAILGDAWRVLRSTLTGWLGAAGGPGAFLAFRALRDLLGGGYRRVDLARLVTPGNSALVGRVMVACGSAEAAHQARRFEPWYARNLAARDRLLEAIIDELAGADPKTAKELAQAMRQNHALTPGQRNLVQDAIDLVGEAEAFDGDIPDFDAPQGPRPSATASPTGTAIVAGLARRYADVWRGWWPQPAGNNVRLGISLATLVKEA